MEWRKSKSHISGDTHSLTLTHICDALAQIAAEGITVFSQPRLQFTDEHANPHNHHSISYAPAAVINMIYNYITHHTPSGSNMFVGFQKFPFRYIFGDVPTEFSLALHSGFF